MEDFLSHIFSRMFSGIAAFLFFMATTCFAIKHPKTPLYHTYSNVQRLWGIAFFQWALHLVVIILFNLREEHFYISNILHLQSYFITLSLVGASATMLLSPKNKNSNKEFFKRRKRHIALFCTLSVIAILFAKSKIIEIISICIMSTFFATELVYLLVKFLRNYRITLTELDNDYSENPKECIGWIKNSIVTVTVFTLIAPLSLYAPTWYISIYSLLGIPTVFFLFIPFYNYRNYLDTLNNIALSESTTEIEKTQAKTFKQLTIPKQNFIESKIDLWIENRGYTQSNLSIEVFAKSLGTNRTYMTRVINNKYNKTFKEWITELRINYAKELLAGEQEFTVSEVSAKTGFSSASYFGKVFTEYTHLSPKKWKEKQYYTQQVIKE